MLGSVSPVTRRQRNEPSQSVDKALEQYYGDPAHLSYARQVRRDREDRVLKGKWKEKEKGYEKREGERQDRGSNPFLHTSFAQAQAQLMQRIPQRLFSERLMR